MRITTVLFDLDGTLLPMDQDVFLKTYFGLLAEHMARYGYEKEKLLKTVWGATPAMIRNNTGKTNEEVFWDCMAETYGSDIRKDKPKFDEYYEVTFPKVRAVCGFDPRAARVIEACKAKGLRVALATSPFFPTTATLQRARWAGLEPADFALITTYANSQGCKPNPAYYRQVLEKLGVGPEQCLMVGNDVEEDMMARELGMDVFLLTPCLINRSGKDIDVYPHGGYDDLLAYIHSL